MNKYVKDNCIFQQWSVFLFSTYLVLSLNPWVTWFYPIKQFVFLCSLCVFIIELFIKKIDIKIRRIFFLSFLYIILIIYSYYWKTQQSFSNLFVTITYMFYFFLYTTYNFYDKEQIKKYINTFFYCILFISFPLYVFIVIISLPFPHFECVHPSVDYGYNFSNYIFLLCGREKIRFQSIFTEPGHLGMILSFILFMNKYDMKRNENRLFLVALLFTFALSAYILLALGFLFFYLSSKKHFFRRLIIITMLVVSVFFICLEFSRAYPKATLSVLIISRLEFDSSKGIAGNNRTSVSFDRSYKKLSFEDKIWGLSYDKSSAILKSAGTSYKTYITNYGYIGIIVILLFFGLYVLKDKISRYKLSCFMLFAISFLQRPYILWPIETYLFLLTVDLNTTKEVIKK